MGDARIIDGFEKQVTLGVYCMHKLTVYITPARARSSCVPFLPVIVVYLLGIRHNVQVTYHISRGLGHERTGSFSIVCLLYLSCLDYDKKLMYFYAVSMDSVVYVSNTVYKTR